LLRPQFVRTQIADLEAIERHVQHLLKAISYHQAESSDGWSAAFDIQPLFFRLTLDAATEFLFGESVDSQLAALPDTVLRDSGRRKGDGSCLDESLFAGAFDRAQAIIAHAGRFGDLYWLAHTKELKAECKTCFDLVDHFVYRALELRYTGKLSLSDSPGHGKYIFAHALAEVTEDPLDIRYQLINILLAGRDTTASMLSWMFLLFTQYPEVYSKLRTIVLSEFGSYEHPRNISFASLKNCSYLQWVLNETLRLFPSVPFNSRCCVQDTTLPVGGGKDGLSPVYVKKGQEVNYTVHVMHRRKDIWGEDADEFRPERWNNRKPTHPFE
jgi:cytochrome P450